MLSLMLVAFIGSSIAQAQDDGWIHGRSSFYGGPGDAASINQGSCQFYNLSPGINGQGYFITAISDTDPDYQGGCGRCYEVACEDRIFYDGYGNEMNRMNACIDQTKSIFVKVTDSCPCNYPANAYSNKRWCCGDNGMRHLDMSYQAFSQLAPMSFGVIGIKFRPVPCTVWSAADGTARPISPSTPHNGSDSSTTATAAGGPGNVTLGGSPAGPPMPEVLAFDGGSGVNASSPSSGPGSNTSSPSPSPSAGSSIVKGGVIQTGWTAAPWGQSSTWTANGAYCVALRSWGAAAFATAGSSGLHGASSIAYSLQQTPPQGFKVLIMGTNGLVSTPAVVSGSSGSYSLPGNADLARLEEYSKVVLRNEGSADATICVTTLTVS